jgi:alpha-acetolactate decarboxylase
VPSAPAVAVDTYGALHEIMHGGDTGPKADLAKLLPGPHLHAIGALSGLRGEITIVDDEVWLAYPQADGSARVTVSDASSEKATLLVTARVSRWTSITIPRAVTSATLDADIETLLRDAGIDTERPVPIAIDGPLVELDWHVVDGSKLGDGAGHEDHVRTAVRGHLATATGSLVGFFSKHHAGVFTHMGRTTHLHAIVRGANVMGHVDATGIAAGAVLRIGIGP